MNRVVPEGRSRWRWCLLLAASCRLFSGLAISQPVDPQLVPVGATWAFFAPGAGMPSGDWRSPVYDDSQWATGVSGFSAIGGEATLLPAPPSASVFFRSGFQVADPSAIRWMTLRIDYSHGFVAYLNGAEICRRGLTGEPPAFDAVAAAHSRGVTEDIEVTAAIGLLQPGTNVLAVQLHGAAVPATDLGVVAELYANFPRGPYLQRLTGNSVDVLWRTPGSAAGSVEYGPTPALGFAVLDAAQSPDHRVAVAGLETGTDYFYRVRSGLGSAEAVSPVYRFRTAPATGAVSFAVLGDSGSGWLPQFQVAAQMAMATPDLILHTGDTAYGALDANTADIRCLSVYAPQLRGVPMYPTFGNHDLYANSTTFLDTFSLPTNTVTGTAHFYSFDHGDVHFVCLFVPTLTAFAGTGPYQLGPGSAQLEWLTNDLAATPRPWRVLYLHSPLFSSAGHRYDDTNGNGIADRLELQRWLLPVASEHGVQLIFSGHDHCYERFAPVAGVHCYVTGGGGQSLYGMVEPDGLSRRFAPVHHFLKVRIDGDTAIVQAVDATGAVFDTAIVPRVGAPCVRVSLLPPDSIRLRWNSGPGRVYAIETADRPSGPFGPVSHSGLPAMATGYEMTLDLDLTLANPGRTSGCFRVVMLP